MAAQQQVANAPKMSGTTSRERPSSGTESVDDRGKPASCPVDQFQPHLVMRRAEGRPVVHSPENLHLHRALVELDLIDAVDELNEAARLKDGRRTELYRASQRPCLIAARPPDLAFNFLRTDYYGRWSVITKVVILMNLEIVKRVSVRQR